MQGEYLAPVTELKPSYSGAASSSFCWVLSCLLNKSVELLRTVLFVGENQMISFLVRTLICRMRRQSWKESVFSCGH